MNFDITHVRNIAIIAHVDHGKTTLVDQLLKQSAAVAAHREMQDRAMDSNDLERERGITILSKPTTIQHTDPDGVDWHINIVDTPGHADFGGEVERVLKMVDSVLLLVDAYEGPMPQTRFVLRKSLSLGLRPIVVINKIDRPDGQPDEVLNAVFDLFVALEADEEQLDFPVVYASARDGYAMHELEDESDTLEPLFETIVSKVPHPSGDIEAPLQSQLATISYDKFVGRIGVARIYDGTISTGDTVEIARPDTPSRTARISKLMRFNGLERVEVKTAYAGEIVMIAGMDEVLPGDTVGTVGKTVAMDAIEIDQPTICMRFMVNDSPFAGREGKYVTSRQIGDRLARELEGDVSLRVEPGESPEIFEVSGRGELHLSILLERMRREGFEMGVSQPRVITREDENGKLMEPWENVTIECGEDYGGTVINKLNQRKGLMTSMLPGGTGMVRIEYRMPSRGLIGFRNEFLTDTRGTGVMYSVFDSYDLWAGDITGRANGALIVLEQGVTTAYSLFTLQERGTLFVGSATDVYPGQIIGEHARANDLVVNPNKKKGLTNVRSAGADEKLTLSTPIDMTLERALEWIGDDELVEITPETVRIRKQIRDHSLRKRAEKSAG